MHTTHQNGNVCVSSLFSMCHHRLTQTSHISLQHPSSTNAITGYAMAPKFSLMLKWLYTSLSVI